MDDSIPMQVLQSHYQIRNEEFGLWLSEASSSADVIPQISSINVFHGQVEVLPILEGMADVDKEGMPQSCQEGALVHH
jgi:hypothetical protein